jgi:RimJ/RimL family protein N-acetyltransferase
MVSFGFERIGLNRVEARCIAENTASARVMERPGCFTRALYASGSSSRVPTGT